MARPMAGSSLWSATCREEAGAIALDRDLDVDLAIVGGGFTGCSAALEAARLGASVALLEAHDIGHGGSGRNVGLVNAGLWLPPDDIAAALGQEAGERLVATLSEAPSRVFDLIERHAIDCEPRRAGTLHCAHAPSGARDLENRFRQGNRSGAPLTLLDADETRARTGAKGLHGALFDPRAGTINPLAYCRGLARAACEAGARLFAPAPVTRLERQSDCWVLSANGQTVRTNALLIATNAYHEGLEGPHAPRFVPFSFSQYATGPLPDAVRSDILPGGEGCWDTATAMTSFRLDAEGRLIVGSVGNREGVGGRIHTAHARRMVRSLFPAAGKEPFRHAWHGTIAMTGDHLPKLLAFGPNALTSFGYSGRGIAPGTVFGAAAARALVTGDVDSLPMRPVTAHAEHFARTRAFTCEFGAALIHAFGPGSR